MKIKMKRLFGIILSLVLVLGLMPWTSLTAYAVETDLSMDDLVRAVGDENFSSYDGNVSISIYVENGVLKLMYFVEGSSGQIYNAASLTYDSSDGRYYIAFSGWNPTYYLVLNNDNYITSFVGSDNSTLTGTSENPFEKASSSGGGDSSSDTSSKTSSSDTSSETSTTVSHTHSYVWEDVKEATEDDNGEMIYKCSCGEVLYRVPTSAYNVFNRNTAEKIKNAKQGATVKIETSRWISFHKMVMQALADRPDVSLEVSFLDGEYKGNRVSFTIPAGTDTLSLLDENGFSGFLYLAGKFGTTN